MPSPATARATLLAHHLYDLAECEHRVALDATLDRSLRTAPDRSTELLLAHGRKFEREIVEPLGYPAIPTDALDSAKAFDQTVAFMREGCPGIDQGVLIDGARLARPDILERAAGASRFGPYLYRPGDVKTARTVRSDAVLQVGFAAILLEAVQGVRPSTGFLILGDSRREEIDLEAIRCTLDDAVAHAESVILGDAPTSPFFSAPCSRCRWRSECLPRLEGKHDLSFVHGMTPARRRVLERAGIVTIDDFAAAEVEALAAAGVPSDGLSRMRSQARALLTGRVPAAGRVTLPRGHGHEAFLRIETDPLGGDEPFSIAWGTAGHGDGAVASRHVAIVSNPEERASALTMFVEALETPGVRSAPIYTYGAPTTRAFELLATHGGLEPSRAGDVAGRIVDLGLWVRRAAPLPVYRYRFDEVAAVLGGRPRPSPDIGEDALFATFAAMRSLGDTTLLPALVTAGHDALDALVAIRSWLAR